MKNALVRMPLPLLLAILSFGLLAAVALSLIAGTSEFGLASLLRLFHGNCDPVERTILLDLRLPRALLALLVGSSLAVSGAVFQALLRNPLAEPYILGLSGGSAVGAIGAAVLGLYARLISVSLSFACALGATLLVLTMAQRRYRLNTHVMILAGVVLNTLFSAVIIVFLSLSEEPQSQTVFFWMMGNLGRVSLAEIALASPFVLLALIGIGIYAHRLNLIHLGEETARQTGISVERDKWVLLLLTSFITALSVSLAGIIGFVGLVVPHIARRLFGPDHRRLLPTSALLGASLLVLSDAIARVLLAPVELPVGVITAALGVPFFLSLLWRENRVA